MNFKHCLAVVYRNKMEQCSEITLWAHIIIVLWMDALYVGLRQELTVRDETNTERN